jgi:hypothetical protein
LEGRGLKKDITAAAEAFCRFLLKRFCIAFYDSYLSTGLSLNCWWIFHSVLFNLAVQYENNEMYTEALNTYQVSEKNLTKEPSK